MNSLSKEAILSDPYFRNSDFCPIDCESKDHITIVTIYSNYRDDLQNSSKFFFEFSTISQHIFSFSGATPQNLANFRLVDRRWHSNVCGFINDQWSQLLKANHLPVLKAKAVKIDKVYLKQSSWFKFKNLFESLSKVLKKQSRHIENLQKCEEKLNDHATAVMWGKLKENSRGLGIAFPKNADISIEDMRKFLKTCNGLGQIKELSLCDLNLQAAPAELGLFTRLEILKLYCNQITHFEIPKECKQLKEIDLEYNQLTSFKIWSEFKGLEELCLGGNQIADFDISGECGLKNLYLQENELTTFKLTSEPGSLQLLNITDNRLTHLELSNKNGRLQELFLAKNQLISLDLSSENLGQISYLDLGITKNQLHNERDNIFMFISDTFLKSFPQNDAVIIFNNEIAYPCQTPLGKLYQAIMKNKDPNEISEELKEMYLYLDADDKKLIMEINTFANSYDFYFAVQQCILKKFDKLSTEEKNRVYDKIYELAGSLGNKDGWGKVQALENIPRLADALAMCS